MFGIYKSPFDLNRATAFAPPTREEVYKGVLSEMSEGRVDRVVHNCSVVDSTAVYERFFLDCHEEIQILARGIKKSIFDRPEVLSAAQKFLLNDTSRLVLHLPGEDEDKDYLRSTEFYRLISSFRASHGRIFLNEYPTKRSEFAKRLPSITTGDDRMYRKRAYDPSNKYSQDARAFVNFNDPEEVSRLKKLISAEVSSLS